MKRREAVVLWGEECAVNEEGSGRSKKNPRKKGGLRPKQKNANGEERVKA
jgi:hypothetical protein